MCDQIYQALKLAAVERHPGVDLPDARRASDILSAELVTLGMQAPGPRVISDFTARHRNPAADPPYSLDALRDSQTDILGLYCTDLRDAEINLYVDSCLLAANDISVPRDHLLQIVLIHEIAHHATAWVVVPSEETRYQWHDYTDCDGGAWTSAHEFFAQALTFLCILEAHEELLNCFRKLSRNQSSVYRTWEVFDTFATNGVGIYAMRDSLRALFLGLLKAGNRLTPERSNIHEILGYDE